MVLAEKKKHTFFDANRIFYVLFTSKLPKYALPLNLFHSYNVSSGQGIMKMFTRAFQMQNKKKINKTNKKNHKEWRGQEEERKGQEKSDHPPDHKPG